MLLPFVIHIPLLIFIVFYHFKRQASSALLNIYWPALFFKLTAGIFIGILYTHYYSYGGDTFVYHNFSSKITSLAKTNFTSYLQFLFQDNYTILDNSFQEFLSQPRVLFMFKVLSILNFLTFNNYWLNACYLSLLSFISLWLLGNSLIKWYNLKPSSIAISFFCFPSFVIWSSGVLKESIITAILMLLIYLFLKSLRENKFSYFTIAIFVLLLYIGWKIKFYYVAILLVTFFTYLMFSFIKKISFLDTTFKKITLFTILFIGLTGLFFLLIPSSVTHYLLDIMYISYKNMIAFSSERTYFTFGNLQPTISSYIYYFPKALLTGLFRPFLWEVSGILTLCESMENIFILLLFISCIYRIIKTRKIYISPELISLILYIIVSASLMAFIAPNWGTLSRYKVSFLLFWVMLLWEYSFPQRWDNQYKKTLFSE